jgi:hypothetical protein
MTLLPCEQARITVPPQDKWPWNGIPGMCQVPGCRERGEPGSHHVVRRSFTGGPMRFVSIDGVVLINEVRLCHRHHSEVTDHFAWIVYEEGNGWVWYVEWKSMFEELPNEQIIKQPKSGRKFRRRGPLK